MRIVEKLIDDMIREAIRQALYKRIQSHVREYRQFIRDNYMDDYIQKLVDNGCVYRYPRNEELTYDPTLLKRVYQMLALKYHPDKHPDINPEYMSLINQAYESKDLKRLMDYLEYGFTCTNKSDSESFLDMDPLTFFGSELANFAKYGTVLSCTYIDKNTLRKHIMSHLVSATNETIITNLEKALENLDEYKVL